MAAEAQAPDPDGQDQWRARHIIDAQSCPSRNVTELMTHYTSLPVFSYSLMSRWYCLLVIISPGRDRAGPEANPPNRGVILPAH